MVSLILTEGSKRWLWCSAIAFLILLIVAAVLIAPHNRLPGRGRARLPIRAIGDKPILQIELARNDGDLVDVLGVGDLKQNVRDARIGNRLDTFLFIPAYSGLLISIGLLIFRSSNGWPAKLALAATMTVPVVSICDWRENAGITTALNHFQSRSAPIPGDADRISKPAVAKWTLLTAILLIYGVAALRSVVPWRPDSVVLAVIGLTTAGGGFLLTHMLFRYFRSRTGT